MKCFIITEDEDLFKQIFHLVEERRINITLNHINSPSMRFCERKLLMDQGCIIVHIKCYSEIRYNMTLEMKNEFSVNVAHGFDEICHKVVSSLLTHQ